MTMTDQEPNPFVSTPSEDDEALSGQVVFRATPSMIRRLQQLARDEERSIGFICRSLIKRGDHKKPGQ